MIMSVDPKTSKSTVALLVTCLVDLYRPSVGFACIKLLESAGYQVVVPKTQTCCGQPAFNNGDNKNAADLAKKLIVEFEHYDYVVAPSGSCIAMLHDYPALFSMTSELHQRAKRLKSKSFEITSFLVDVVDYKSIDSSFQGAITYHDSCSGLRNLAIKDQPRKLLAQVKDAEVKEMKEADACCGFGGTFCVKYPEISNQMVTDKIESICATDADLLVSGEMGCLLNIVGKLKRENKTIQARHIVEALVGSLSTPAIAENSLPIQTKVLNQTQ
jgi:L-lactate dehydrogenase complex protein LldE